MGIQIENITDEPHQRHTILFEESEIVLNLRYHPTVEMWVIDVEYKTARVLGLKLSLGVLHMRSKNLPFDFVIIDQSGTDLDPIRLDDFATGRCSLYMLDADDMEVVRGAPVPL